MDQEGLFDQFFGIKSQNGAQNSGSETIVNRPQKRQKPDSHPVQHINDGAMVSVQAPEATKLQKIMKERDEVVRRGYKLTERQEHVYLDFEPLKKAFTKEQYKQFVATHIKDESLIDLSIATHLKLYMHWKRCSLQARVLQIVESKNLSSLNNIFLNEHDKQDFFKQKPVTTFKEVLSNSLDVAHYQKLCNLENQYNSPVQDDAIRALMANPYTFSDFNES